MIALFDRYSRESGPAAGEFVDSESINDRMSARRAYVRDLTVGRQNGESIVLQRDPVVVHHVVRRRCRPAALPPAERVREPQ
jgi:hypothetical protein